MSATLETIELATCGDCGDRFDPTGPDIRATQFGDVRCAPCHENYYTCDVCGDETHSDDIVGWDGAPVCLTCDDLYGGTCDVCETRLHADSLEYCCKPSIPCKP